MLKLKVQYFGYLMRKATYLKRLWCWERLRARGEGNDGGWDGWMASLTQWTWVCVNPGSCLWTGSPGMLQSWGRRVEHWATELNLAFDNCFHSIRYPYGFFRGLLQVFQISFMQFCSHNEKDSYACKCGYMTLLSQKTIINNMITGLQLGLTFLLCLSISKHWLSKQFV